MERRNEMMEVIIIGVWFFVSFELESKNIN